MKFFALSALVSAVSISASANDIETARMLIENGNLEDAKIILSEPKIKNSPEARLLSGRICFLEYDLKNAAANYAAYKKARRNKNISDSDDIFFEQLSLAESFLEKVEDIAILDSITVDRNEFLSVYRLPKAAGQILPASAIPFGKPRGEASMAFANETSEFMMWAQPDATGKKTLFETSYLNDGTWQTPESLPESLGEGGNADYPFMLSDGTTLYFASDGEGSMGGYDIFVATKDPSTGEYLQPSNLGMPYNSPYDDYMLAIDELNGVGWWATDRNRIEGKTTVYIFATNDVRKNIDPEIENPVFRARLNDWKSTQYYSDKDYASLLNEIRNIKEPKPAKKADFYLPVSSDKIYTTFSDFSSKAAADKMRAYILASNELQKTKEQLNQMRMQFHKTHNSEIGNKIQKLEQQVDSYRANAKRLLNEVYKLEKGNH